MAVKITVALVLLTLGTAAQAQTVSLGDYTLTPEAAQAVRLVCQAANPPDPETGERAPCTNAQGLAFFQATVTQQIDRFLLGPQGWVASMRRAQSRDAGLDRTDLVDIAKSDELTHATKCAVFADTGDLAEYNAYRTARGESACP